MIRHLKILEYALLSILRRKARNFTVGAVFSLTVAILGSILLLTSALESEAERLLGPAPDLVVQRLSAGRHDLIPLDYAAAIGNIPGVGAVSPRIWGYYYDALTESNYTIMGISPPAEDLELLEGRFPAEPWECAVGEGVAGSRHVSTGEDLILVDSGSTGVSLEVVGTFTAPSRLLTNDLVVMTPGGVRDFFALPEGLATDLVVAVPNPAEVGTVAAKVKRRYPDTRPITKGEILRTYKAAFNWRSGMMLAAFSGALLAFAILAWDRAAGISAAEKREIGILKAVGWDTADVLALKFWEGAALSVTALLFGIILAYGNVAFLGGGPLATVLKGWSVLFPDFELLPRMAPRVFFYLGFATVAPYVAATLLPVWKAAVTDPEDAIRR